jgi:hypothetical protein
VRGRTSETAAPDFPAHERSQGPEVVGAFLRSPALRR